MLYNIYYTTKKLKFDDGIWLFMIYQDNKKSIFTESKYVSFINKEFDILPICAALLWLSRIRKPNDLFMIMTNNTDTINIIQSFINNTNTYHLSPTFNKYSNLEFYKFKNQIGIASIPLSLTYYSHNIFKHNKSFEFQQNIEKKIKNYSKKFS